MRLPNQRSSIHDGKSGKVRSREDGTYKEKTKNLKKQLKENHSKKFGNIHGSVSPKAVQI